MKPTLNTLTVLAGGILVLGLAGSTAYAGGTIEPVFDAANFSNPLNINNPYWPLVPGTTFTYRSVAKDECQVNDVTVTDVTPVIDGIMTRQVLDQVFEDDECDGIRDFLSETTLDWYAQDDAGNVWYMGENTQACDPDTNVCSTEGSWTAGVDGAEPGYVMLADPTAPGTSYSQEYLGGAAEDMAKILRNDALVSLVFDNELDQDEYPGCLVTKEWSPLEHGAVEHKFYYPGVGLVLINEFQGGTVRTELVGISGP